MTASEREELLEATKIICRAAAIYQKEFVNKNFLFLSKTENSINKYVVEFTKKNFLHFTGMKTTLSKLQFYNTALKNRLSIDDFSFKNYYHTPKKLAVLDSAMRIHKDARMCGVFLNGRFIELEADFGIGNHILSFAFRYDENDYSLPSHSVSLLDYKIKEVVRPAEPIIAIISKNKNEELFNTVTYKSKNINTEKLHFPKEICDMLTPEALREIKPNIDEQIRKRDKKAQRKQPQEKDELTKTSMSERIPEAILQADEHNRQLGEAPQNTDIDKDTDDISL